MRNADIFFFNDTATTEIYTLSLHDALPISIAQYFGPCVSRSSDSARDLLAWFLVQHAEQSVYWDILATNGDAIALARERSEEHTSELQSQSNLVCRLLLEKKRTKHSEQRLP